MHAILTAGFLTLSPSSEPRPLSKDVQAVRIYEGSARLLNGEEPDSSLTLLPAGVYFTNRGYDTLNIATQQLQANLHAMEGKVRDYEAAALTPCPEVESPPLKGWTARDMVLVGAVGVVVGLVGGVVLVGLARAQ